MNKFIKSLVLIVLLVAASGYFYIDYLKQQHSVQQEQYTQRVNKTASLVSSLVIDWTKSIEVFSNKPELAMHLNDEPNILDEWLSVQRKKTKSLKRIRVLLPDHVEVDRSGSSPLGYADLGLIRAVESSKKIQLPEIHLLGSEAEHISLAYPLIKGDKVERVILFSFSVKPLQTLFKKSLAGLVGSKFELRQGELKISASGDQSIVLSKGVNSVAIPRSRWRIATGVAAFVAPIEQETIVFYALLTLGLIGFVVMMVRVLSHAENREKLKVFIQRKGAPKQVTDTAGKAEDEHAIKKVVDFKVEENKREASNVVTEKRVDNTQERSIEIGAKNNNEKNRPLTSHEPLDPLILKEDVIEVPVKEEVPASIFRAYDIRGIVNSTLTEFGVFTIGRAIGSEAQRQGQKTVVIARDGRLHSPRLSESLSKGLRATGCDVVDVGEVPTPVLYFSTHHVGERYLGTQTGVMLTGSHNPADYNGLKIMIAGNTLSGDAIQELYQSIKRNDFIEGKGSYQEQKMLPEYIGEICNDVKMGRLMKVVVDCGNGVAGEAAPLLLSTLGCEVVPLYCEIDGRFPNHHPDPSKPENLQELIEKVRSEEAELGLAFDGDGDRLGVVDSDGNIIWPDRQMMLYAKDVLSRNVGADIIYDVKCSTNLAKVIKEHGGNPIMSQTGHSLIKAKMRETKAALAGEMSGHIFFKERWYGFDDALYTAARLLEVLSADFKSTADVFAELPDSISTPELNIEMKEGENFTFIEQLVKQASFDAAKIITIDGLRVEFPDGWGLVRASNTTPSLVLRFEADTEAALQRIKLDFAALLMKVKPNITLPF